MGSLPGRRPIPLVDFAGCFVFFSHLGDGGGGNGGGGGCGGGEALAHAHAACF